MASFLGLWLAVFLALYVLVYRPWLNDQGSRLRSRWNRRARHHRTFHRILFERLHQTVSGFSNKEMNELVAELDSVDADSVLESDKDINDFYQHTTHLWKLGVLPIRYEQEPDIDDDAVTLRSNSQ